MVDVIQLKNEAKELTNLSNALPAQMEQIGNGRLPKELIDTLKKIEKLANLEKQLFGNDVETVLKNLSIGDLTVSNSTAST